MPGVSLSTKETVACEQPAALAMSVMVTRPLGAFGCDLRRFSTAGPRGSVSSFMMSFPSPTPV